jgi:hypothetical protein
MVPIGADKAYRPFAPSLVLRARPPRAACLCFRGATSSEIMSVLARGVRQARTRASTSERSAMSLVRAQAADRLAGRHAVVADQRRRARIWAISVVRF